MCLSDYYTPHIALPHFQKNYKSQYPFTSINNNPFYIQLWTYTHTLCIYLLSYCYHITLLTIYFLLYILFVCYLCVKHLYLCVSIYKNITTSKNYTHYQSVTYLHIIIFHLFGMFVLLVSYNVNEYMTNSIV